MLLSGGSTVVFDHIIGTNGTSDALWTVGENLNIIPLFSAKLWDIQQ